MLFSRQTVRDLIHILDTGRVELMKKQRLRRRVYSVKGPNHMWHIDGNDKIKRFGFCISGAIDGWSHFLIWLKCDVTNKNPTLIANYYLEAVDKHNTIPVTLCMDPGTENVHIQDIQNVLRIRE
jgi:hypothetical protein